MMINWRNVDSFRTTEGIVDRASVNGSVVWERGGEPISENWKAFFRAVDNGTYAANYRVGNIIDSIDLGIYGKIDMQIAGFNKDTLEDGSGMAAVSIIGKQLLTTVRGMNLDLTNPDGGWKETELRSFLNGEILGRIPDAIRGRIEPIKKTHKSCYSNGVKYDQTTVDSLWIPSYSEVFTSGDKYAQLFNNNTARTKYIYNGAKSSWWLRQESARDLFYYTSYAGTASMTSGDSELGVALCFCIGKGNNLLKGSRMLMTAKNDTFEYPEWEPDVMMCVGERIAYNGELYRVKVRHLSQIGLEPDVARDLFELSVKEE